MKLLIDIPSEFGLDFINNKFEDCFQRLLHDTKDRLDKHDTLLAGNYEIETLEMFIKAFKNATEVQLYEPIDSVIKIPEEFLNKNRKQY